MQRTLFALLLAAAPLAAQGKPPWKAGDRAPALLGLHIGDTRAKLDAVMGPPEGTQVLGEGVVALSYRHGTVIVTWARLDGVATIDLKSPDAGDIAGIRVGGSIDDLVAKWGQPPQGDNNVGLWVFGPWAVVVRADDAGKKIVMLSLGRVA